MVKINISCTGVIVQNIETSTFANATEFRDKANLVSKALNVASNYQFVNAEEVNVLVAPNGSSASVKFFSVVNDKFILVNLKRNASEWVITRKKSNQDELVNQSKSLNVSLCLSRYVKTLSTESYFFEKTFRIQLYDFKDKREVLCKVTKSPFTEWNSQYITLNNEGKLISIVDGY